jgi:hypothetical protein
MKTMKRESRTVISDVLLVREKYVNVTKWMILSQISSFGRMLLKRK